MERINDIKKRAEELDGLLSSNHYSYQFNKETSDNIINKLRELKDIANKYSSLLDKKARKETLSEMEELFIWAAMDDIIEPIMRINTNENPNAATHYHIADALDKMGYFLYSINRRTKDDEGRILPLDL